MDPNPIRTMYFALGLDECPDYQDFSDSVKYEIEINWIYR